MAGEIFIADKATLDLTKQSADAAKNSSASVDSKLTPTRAANIDKLGNLDASVNSRQSEANAVARYNVLSGNTAQYAGQTAAYWAKVANDNATAAKNNTAGGGSVIKSIQRGTMPYSRPAYFSEYIDIVIASVNINKALLLFDSAVSLLHSSSPTDGVSNEYAILFNSTTLRVYPAFFNQYREATYTAAAWQVIEFN